MDAAEPTRRRADPVALATLVWVALAVVFLALTIPVAVALPYGAYDAMAVGTWSHLMAVHWPTFHYAGLYAADYQRPLFYVLQGFVWHLFGFHQWLGRLLSLAFSVVLALALAWIASRTARPYRAFAAALAVVVLILITNFDVSLAAGLTDIPVAAMTALTAALLLAPRLGRAQLPLVGLAAALAVLTKPSALPALAGLGAAVLIGRRDGLRRRAYAVLAIALGIGAGLVYDGAEAHRAHLGLHAFLVLGTGGYYAQLADQLRTHTLLDAGWLGPDLRLFLWFAIVYAIARLASARHRIAVLIAFPVAVIWAWLGPHLASGHGAHVGFFGTSSVTKEIAIVVLAVSLLLALLAPDDVVPGRLELARLLVWALPTIVLWALDGVYDTRLISPAWPPLVVLVTRALVPAFAGARRRSEWLIAVPAAAVVVLGLFATYNINGLGASGWQQLRAAGLSGLSDAAAMRSIALGGDFAAEMNALVPQVRPTDRILTFDGRLPFFYLDQIDLQGESSCRQLPGHRLFVLLEDDELRAQFGNRASSAFWEACKNVTLTKIAERPGAFAVFVNGTPTPQAGGCGVTPPQDQGLAIEFGRFRTAADANTALKRIVATGFTEAKVEQLGCSLYRIVETGVPSKAVGESIIAEAKSAGFTVKLVSGSGG